MTQQETYLLDKQ